MGKLKKRKKILWITLCVIAALFGFLKIYYAIGNHKFNNKINELKDNGQMNFQIESKIDHKIIEINGNTIHYFVSGNKEGETVVFLHPAFGDHTCFDRQIDCFSPNYRVITIDMSGHGLTGIGKSKDKISATSTHIAEILKAENQEKIHIAGVSLGSLLAQDFALKYPEQILSLTVLGGYCINKEQKEVAKAQGKEMFKWLFKMIFSMDAFRRYVASVSVTDELEQIRFYESAKHFTRRSFTVMSGLDRLIANRNVQRNFRLLILSGENDSELAIKAAKQWHEEEQTSKMFIIEKAGHCANMDNAERFNSILMDFITAKE
jgi:pimeloyl-ACP methyl ester carboxylesterase